jgi:hypothetical protein
MKMRLTTAEAIAAVLLLAALAPTATQALAVRLHALVLTSPGKFEAPNQ